MNKIVDFLPALNHELKIRDASGSIRGYLYQFEKTVLDILRSDRDSVVRIEGVEDVDLASGREVTAVQIKYWDSKKSFTNKAVAEPVFEMLKTVPNYPEMNFKLYLHFGGDSPRVPSRMSEDDIRQAFQSSAISSNPQKQKIVDDLDEYIGKLASQLSLEEGPEIGFQRDELRSEIESQLNCESDEAAILHLPRAVHIINAIACNPNESERVITKAELLQQLNVQPRLFASWYRRYLDEKDLESYLVGWMRKARFNERNLHRLLIVDLADASICSGADLIEELGKNLTDEKALTSATPWTVVASLDQQPYYELKRELATRGVVFNDGYEHFGFNRSIFHSKPIFERANNGPRVTRASFSVRLINLATLKSKGLDFENARVAAFGCLDELAGMRIAPIVAVQGLSAENITEIIRKVRQNG